MSNLRELLEGMLGVEPRKKKSFANAVLKQIPMTGDGQLINRVVQRVRSAADQARNVPQERLFPELTGTQGSMRDNYYQPSPRPDRAEQDFMNRMWDTPRGYSAEPEDEYENFVKSLQRY